MHFRTLTPRNVGDVELGVTIHHPKDPRHGITALANTLQGQWTRHKFRTSSARWLTPLGISRYVTYLLGCVGFSFGVLCFAAAGLGADPLYVFSTGIQKRLHFNSYAVAEGGFAAAMLIFWAIWNRRVPIISPFVTFVLCGRLIDFGKKNEIASYLPYTQWPLMVTGVVLCAYASSLIIMSGIGIRAMDLIAITMVERFRREFWVFKTAMESTLLFTGWLLLGTPSVQLQPGAGIVMGVGTLCFVVFVDLLIQPFMAANRICLGMRNHGLPGDRSSLEYVPQK